MVGREKENQADLTVKRIKTRILEDNSHHGRTRWNRGLEYTIYLWEQLWSGSVQPDISGDGRKDQVWICVYRVYYWAECSEHTEEIPEVKNPWVQRKLHNVSASNCKTGKSDQLENATHRIQRESDFQLHLPKVVHYLPFPMHCPDKQGGC